ncbi:MAG: tyrosine-type recombinase/integrase [Proteobacteria bacterium]|nr:tyrosine-type recombinase/integrase [Pseudomonadota bacterium]
MEECTFFQDLPSAILLIEKPKLIGQKNMDVFLPAHLPPLGPLPSPSDDKKILASFFLNARSPLTAREYRLAAEEFFRFLGEEVRGPTELQRHHIVFYRKWLEQKGLANKTIQKKLAAISSLCKFLAEAGLIEKDIAYGVARPRTENRRETADISDENVRKIFASLNPKSYTYASHRAILAVGFFTGLRSSEIRTLRMRDLGSVNGIKIFNLKVKGDKVHEIPLHPFVISALDEHLNALQARGFKVDEAEHVLFPSLKTGENRPMSAEALDYILKSAMDQAGIERSKFRRYSPHSMRATFAGHLLNTVEARLEDVQAAMGHANPSTTQRYNKRSKGHDRSPVFKMEF